jgi:hypothetical protein
MNPAFKYNKLNSLIPIFVELSEEMLGLWEAELDTGKKEIDVNHFLKNITFDVIGNFRFC